MHKPTKHILLLLLAVLLNATPLLAQQQIQLYVEDFEGTTSSFLLNDTSAITTNSGANKWIVNNQYNGAPTYPNTISQDSTNFGTIFNAPNSKYLHIHDSINALGSGAANCNFNPTAASDRFSHLANGFCTLGMQDVKVVFFYIAEADSINVPPNAYGELLYSIDGGAWVSTGTQYYGQKRWKYEQVTNPAFDNVANLRLGFRWVNNGTAQANTSSFGIDDIQVVGTYDDVNNPITISAIDLFPDPICQLNNLFIQWQLSAPLCNGVYRIQLSNASGNFNNPTDLGVFNIAQATTGFIAATIPGNIAPGACYRIRISRVSPAPAISGVVSACFVIQNCPNIINTLSAAVTTDPDTVCSRSAIDIKFTSTGVFAANNTYIAELSDSNGNFTTPQFLGSLPSSQTFDPALGSPPGTVSGLIPATPAGCNYFIRIRSTNPATQGTVFGPFCIKQCDMETNETLDMAFCISETAGVDTIITVDINYWDSIAQYANGNLFQLQLLDMNSLAIVNTGALAAEFDTVSNTMTLTIPGLNILTTFGIAPGAYYARIISDSSSVVTNQNGTIIRITIGAPSSVPPMIIGPDSVICDAGVQAFVIDPYNPDSDYEWASNGLNNGNAFIWPGNTLLVDWTGAQINNYTFYVREINYGCYGPFSDAYQLDVISTPTGNISGPDVVCLGDTAVFNVPFIKATFYEWEANFGRIVDTSNNEILVVFDSVGTATLSNFALNKCGGNTVSFNVEVVSLLEVVLAADTTVCAGEPVKLTAQIDPSPRELETTFNATSNTKGFMFDVTSITEVTIDSISVGVSLSNTPLDVSVYLRSGSYQGHETTAADWLFWGSTVVQNPVAGNFGTIIPIQIFQSLPAGDTLGIYVHVNNGNNVRFRPATGFGNPISTDGLINLHPCAVMGGLFTAPLQPRVWAGSVFYSTTSGLGYIWSNGDTTQTTTFYPTQSETVEVIVSNPTGCGNTGRVNLGVLPGPTIDAGADADICLGEVINIEATANGGNITWTPTTGLADPTALTQSIRPNTSINYILAAEDLTTGCKAQDTLSITVSVDQTEEDTVFICINKDLILQLPDVAGSSYLWSTGETTRSIQVTETGTYTAQYTPGGLGCATLYVFNAESFDCENTIKIPAAFTPNNDGLNDHFTIFAQNLSDYTIKIYNRWGELVYESSDMTELNDLGRGWDGSYKGALQNFGTFVYFIQAKDVNGSPIEKQGHLTLIR
jgi:gliding motility-associated-like protein